MKALSVIVWNDIKRGQNIDQYLAIALAFGLGIVQLFGASSSAFVSNLTLAVLGLIAVSLLINRHRFEKLSQQVMQPTSDLVRHAVNNAGLFAYCSTREEKDLVKMIEEAEKKLDFLGTSLPDMSKDQSWKALRNRLEEKPALRIRILLLSPRSIMAYKKQNLHVYRHYKWKNISDEIYKSMQVFKSIAEELKNVDENILDRYHVKVYATIPTTSCVFNDQYLNISFYDENEPASISPAWVFRKSDETRSLYNYYQKHFEKIWEDSISIFDPEFEAKIRQGFEKEVEDIQNMESFE